MSLRHEVLIRILVLLQRKTLLETTNHTWKSLKPHYSTVQSMKNVAVLTEDRAFAVFFRPHHGGFDSSRVPTPRNLPSKAKKMLTPGGQPGRGEGGGGGAECSWNWLMHYQSNINAPQKGTRILFYGHVPHSFPPLRGSNSTTTNYITGTANFNVNKDYFWTLCSQGLFASIVINLYQAPERYRDNSGSSYFRF